MNEKAERIISEVKGVIKGKDEIIEKVLMAVLARGNVLLEDVPGVGKTSLAVALGRTLGLEYNRIQCTPDVLPSDIVGFSVFNKEKDGFTYMPGIINNTNLVFSNVSEMMSRQLSNLLNRMDIPVDLGVGYQQNAEGTDLYDVSVSTELFDNRVEVRGSFGNRQYSTSNNPNGEMVGDLDIDVKLDKAGELRFNLFSHSADEYTSYLDYSQRNGVGITYQKEFGKWKDFWKSLFRSSRKRREAAAEATLSEEKKTIVIEADE